MQADIIFLGLRESFRGCGDTLPSILLLSFSSSPIPCRPSPALPPPPSFLAACRIATRPLLSLFPSSFFSAGLKSEWPDQSKFQLPVSGHSERKRRKKNIIATEHPGGHVERALRVLLQLVSFFFCPVCCSLSLLPSSFGLPFLPLLACLRCGGGGLEKGRGRKGGRCIEPFFGG